MHKQKAPRSVQRPTWEHEKESSRAFYGPAQPASRRSTLLQKAETSIHATRIPTDRGSDRFPKTSRHALPRWPKGPAPPTSTRHGKCCSSTGSSNQGHPSTAYTRDLGALSTRRPIRRSLRRRRNRLRHQHLHLPPLRIIPLRHPPGDGDSFPIIRTCLIAHLRHIDFNPSRCSIARENPSRMLPADPHHATLQRAGERSRRGRRRGFVAGNLLILRIARAQQHGNRDHHQLLTHNRSPESPSML